MVIGASWVLSKTISRQMEQGLDTLQWEKSREEEEIAELQKNTAFLTSASTFFLQAKLVVFGERFS